VPIIFIFGPMKIGFRIIIIVLLLISCACNDDAGIDNKHQNNVPDIPLDIDDDVEEEELNDEIIIDDNDLVILPEDTGGISIAYPLHTTKASFGHYVYTPGGYKPDGPDYPLLIFLHGWNPNLGNEPLKNVLSSGPSKLIAQNKWSPKHPFIVVSPQLESGYWPPYLVHRFIKYLIDTYQINVSRIYLTGLSLGGGGCWYYVGEIDDNYAAAIVPISASGAPHLVDNLRKVPVWAFHGAVDRTVEAYENYGSVPLVEAINATNPIVPAKVSVYPNVGHDAWTITYDGTGRDYFNLLYDPYSVDLYEWMLQYKKE
jgi:hypothetical protein